MGEVAPGTIHNFRQWKTKKELAGCSRIKLDLAVETWHKVVYGGKNVMQCQI